jgi:hypothetical protein
MTELDCVYVCVCACNHTSMQYSCVRVENMRQNYYVVILHGAENIPTVVIGFHCKLMHFESANEMKMSIIFPECSIYAKRYIFGVTLYIFTSFNFSSSSF